MEKRYITPTVLNRYLKNKFDTDPNIRQVSLRAEISNYKGHTRGHLYFTLKDETSRINAVMFQSAASKLKFVPVDGMKVLVTGRVSIYEASGAYQIYVESMEEDGLGNLYLKFEELKRKLAEEGLFNADLKKEIPKYPQKIGIITAPTGAAIRDILSTIKRRYPACNTILFPSLVQGELAAANIVKQIELADTYGLDCLIVGRGGGSIEDLWAFNEEIVARAIFKAKTPIISAVGHEIDFTIADFVADLRAPTPTGAAEMAVPNLLDIKTILEQLEIRLNKHIKNALNTHIKKLDNLKTSYVLTSPLAPIEIKEEKLSNFITNLEQLIKHKLEIATQKYENIKNKNILLQPNTLLIKYQQRYQLNFNKLELLNPLNILNKGYSIIKKDNKPIKYYNDLKENDIINIKLHEGNINAIVKEVYK